MTKTNKILDFLYDKLLSERTKQNSERVIIAVAITSFVLHLALIVLKELGFLPLLEDSELLNNPIAAIYTPFSFILLYEVYLLVYYLPKSFSLYISKQYEIITLVIIRRIFKDLSNLDLASDWFKNTYDLQLTFDLITTLILFTLILFFYKLNQTAAKIKSPTSEKSPKLKRLIKRKKILAVCLVPIFIVLAIYSFGDWIYLSFILDSVQLNAITDINQVFFNEFFTVLILADVLLLLFSLFHTDKFNTVIRNSGFIISTILIRLSFSTAGLTNNVLITTAVAFGVLILLLHNQYEKNESLTT